MKVLVTGAGGFIGSHVTEMLLRCGHSVRALARYNGKGSWGHLSAVPANLHRRLEVKLGDVRDSFLVRDLVVGCPHSTKVEFLQKVDKLIAEAERAHERLAITAREHVFESVE